MIGTEEADDDFNNETKEDLNAIINQLANAAASGSKKKKDRTNPSDAK